MMIRVENIFQIFKMIFPSMATAVDWYLLLKNTRAEKI